MPMSVGCETADWRGTDADNSDQRYQSWYVGVILNVINHLAGQSCLNKHPLGTPPGIRITAISHGGLPVNITFTHTY